MPNPDAAPGRSKKPVGSSPESDAPAAALPAALSAAAGTDAAAEEREWLASARAGDAAAFGRLVERYQDRVYGLALRLTRSPEDAEEVAQDGLVRAWRALPRFRGEASFSTWLHRIVIRCAFDRNAVVRARRARETSLESAGPIADPAGPGSEPTAIGAASSAGPLAAPLAGATELSIRLQPLLASLSEMQRAVVALYYYEDRSVEEVARTLGVPTGTVKTHLHRARALLRERWTREELRRSGS